MNSKNSNKYSEDFTIQQILYQLQYLEAAEVLAGTSFGYIYGMQFVVLQEYFEGSYE